MNKKFGLFAVLLLCAFSLFIAGCEKSVFKSAPKPPSADFSADFTGSFNSLDVSGRLSASHGSLMNLKIDEPQTLSGLEISYKDSCVALNRDDISCTADEAYLPNDSFPSTLRAAVKSIADGRIETSDETEEMVTYSLSGDFDLITDRNGAFIGLKSKNDTFELNFSNFRIDTPQG